MDSLDDFSESCNDGYAYSITCHLIEPCIGETCGLCFVELLVRESLQSPALNRHELSDLVVIRYTVQVLRSERKHGFFGILHSSALLSDAFTVGSEDCSWSFFSLFQNSGMLTSAVADTCILSGSNATGKLGDLGFGIHIDKINTLRDIRRDRVCDLFADSTSTGVQVRICQIDAVAGFGYLISRFGQGFDGKLSYRVETCISGETAAVARQSATQSVLVIDSVALSATELLNNSFWICVGER